MWPARRGWAGRPSRTCSTAAAGWARQPGPGCLRPWPHLGYQPHHGARSLRSRRTRQIAYVLPRVQLIPGNYIMQQFLQALAAASGRRGYGMVVVVPDGDPRDDMRRLIASRSVDAFLLSEHAAGRSARDAAGRRRDAVRLLRPDRPRRCRSTGSTSTTTRPSSPRPSSTCWPGASPASPSSDTGREPTGTTTGPPASGPGSPAMASSPTRLTYCWWTRAAPAGRSGHCSPALTGRPPGPRPDAIVTGSDRLAAMIYGVAAELRLRIGRDLGVTGFDGSSRGRPAAPAADQRDHPDRRHRPARGGPGAAAGRPRPDRVSRRGGGGHPAAGREHRRAGPRRQPGR